MSSKVSIIIVNWNGKQHLETCLSSLSKQDYQTIEIILVDNASSDDSVAFVQTQYPKVKIIQNNQNLGFAEGNNVGFGHATGEYVLFLNNDTRVMPDFLSKLLSPFHQEPKLGAVQSKILLMDEPNTFDSVGAFLTHTGFLYHYGVAKPDSKKYDHFIKIYSAKGACMLWRKSVLDEICLEGKPFDKKYFAYFEETDLCHRCWLAGYHIMYVPDSVVFHKVGATSTTMNNGFIQFHSFKNRIHSYLKNLEVSNLVKMLPVHFLFCQIFAIASICMGKLNVAIGIEKAIWWNIQQFSSTLKTRRYVQTKIRKVSDKVLYKHCYKKVKLSYYFFLLFDLKRYEDPEITS